MVVQPALVHQLVAKGIDAGQTGAAAGDVVGQVCAVGRGRQAAGALLAVVPDALAQLLPDALPVVTPAELVDQLLPALRPSPRAARAANTACRISARVSTPWRM